MRPGLAAVFAVSLAACAAPRPAADLVLTGRFLTLDPARPEAQAVAVREGRIVALGSRDAVLRFAGPGARRVPLPGVALPGFAEAHGHALALGEQLERLDLRGLSRTGVLEAVARAVRRAGPGAWILGQGWDQGRWSPPEYPTAQQLDAVAPAHPVLLIRIDLHSAWLNTRALELAGVSAATPDPAGGRVLRDAAGRPSGILIDAAYESALRAVPAPSRERVEARLEAALQRYLSWGVTSLHDAGVGSEELALYQELDATGRLPLRVYALIRGQGEDLERALARGPWSSNSGRLSVRGFKVLLDGALGSRGAELLEPYSDAPAETGLVLMDDAALASLVRRATRRGFQVAAHAIGDRAVRRALDAFEAGGLATRRLRPRIEHVSVVDPADLPRFAALGVIASLQPNFVGEYGRWAVERVGPERIEHVYPTRRLLASGALIATGSDYPAADSGDPLVTLDALLTRRGADGEPEQGFLPSERIGTLDALRSMTLGAARAAFQEDVLGMLRVGRYADLTVLSGDPLQTPADAMRRLKVLATLVSGEVVYSEPAGSAGAGSRPAAEHATQ